MEGTHPIARDFAALVEDGRVASDLYTDPAVFDAEMERIFGRTWVYLAHESEIAVPGDFKAVNLGLRPVIVVRDPGGRVRVFHNRCRHRGTTVCQDPTGNTRSFRCEYHGWTYATDGRLLGVPYPSRYDASFRLDDYALEELPRLGMYRGFIWASLADAGPSIEEHLGPVRDLIDQVVGVSPVGEIALTTRSQRFGYDGTWKLQMENAVDGYHVNFVHQSFAQVQKKALAGRYAADFSTSWSDTSPAVTRDLGNGHGILDKRCFAPYAADERNAGGFNLAVFPNLIIIGSQVRSVWPVAWNRTEVTVQPMVFKGLENLTESRLRTHELFYGPAGFGQPDDLEIFRRVVHGLRSGTSNWVDLSRGLGREQTEGNTLVGQVTDELPQRAFYRMWKRLMAG